MPLLSYIASYVTFTLTTLPISHLSRCFYSKMIKSEMNIKKKVPLSAISHNVLVVLQRLCKNGFPVINQKVISAAVCCRGLRVRDSNFEGEYFHVGKVGLPKKLNRL